MQKFLIFFSLLLIIVLLPCSARAAVLYLEPSSGEYQPGNTFIVEVKIDSEGECINAIEANLSFTQDFLEAVDFSRGNSILNLWVKPPEINQESGLISFIGGIPGGYCGRILEGVETSETLGQIIFKIPETMVGESIDSAKVEILKTSQVLLNDGFGTSAKLTTKGAVFTISPEKLKVSKDEWQEELEKDTIPPEPFTPKIGKDSSVFNGKYFIAFFTQDKQTGISYYQVKEGEKAWQEATSPYLLENQSLRSIIKVKAVDKAGNERIETLYPAEKPFPYWIIILILVGVGVIVWLIAKLRGTLRETTRKL